MLKMITTEQPYSISNPVHIHQTGTCFSEFKNIEAEIEFSSLFLAEKIFKELTDVIHSSPTSTNKIVITHL